MMVLTLARGSNTSLDRRGELLTTGVFDTVFNAVLPGVVGAVVSNISLCISLVEVNQAIISL